MAALNTAVFAGDLQGALEISPNLLEALSWMLRSLITAPPGKDLIGGDYSSIEARVLSWMADQQDKLKLFHAGADIYMVAAKNAGSADRQFGKVQELALQYGMGVKTFRDTAANFGITIDLKTAWKVHQAWRKNNLPLVMFWERIETAALRAVLGGEPQEVGPLRLHADKQCLYIRLPSGRALHYWRPHIREAVRQIETVNSEGEIKQKDVRMTELRFYTAGADRKGMDLESTYGGKLAENVTQAVSRDLLAAALLRLDQTTYDVVLHVHDSVVSEVPKGTGSVLEFEDLMATNPGWASGLPTAVKGYRSDYFLG
jgi:DNA polymerase